MDMYFEDFVYSIGPDVSSFGNIVFIWAAARKFLCILFGQFFVGLKRDQLSLSISEVS